MFYSAYWELLYFANWEKKKRIIRKANQLIVRNCCMSCDDWLLCLYKAATCTETSVCSVSYTYGKPMGAQQQLIDLLFHN